MRRKIINVRWLEIVRLKCECALLRWEKNKRQSKLISTVLGERKILMKKKIDEGRGKNG